MEKKSCLPLVLTFLLVLVAIAAEIVAIVGFFKLGFNVIDYITERVADRTELVINFLMFAIGEVVGKVLTGVSVKINSKD